MNQASEKSLIDKISNLNRVGIALSVETNYERLMELILRGAMELTNADGGTIYRVTPQSALRFEVIINHSLKIASGGTSHSKINFPTVPLFKDGHPNQSNVVSCSVHEDRTINIEDVYNIQNYDFLGTREFDKRSGYRTTSMLAVPMKNHEKDIIGVLQLINCKEEDGIISFSKTNQQLAESLASQAAVAITNKQLVKDLQNLFDSLTQLIAQAIDEKSPYTGNHCRRIPILTMLLAEAASRCAKGPLAAFTMQDADRLELNTAAWLHDCGKVTSPDFIMDKSTKLEMVCDRIETIDLRIETLIQSTYAQFWKAKALNKLPTGTTEESVEKEVTTLKEMRSFLRKINIGGESLAATDIEKINAIEQILYTDVDGLPAPLIDEYERLNLSVKRGTLNSEERLVINNHMVATVNMLDSMPFPKHLQRVPEYAGGHHEKMDGMGYPKGLKKEEMSIPARIMAIADIFEALTASDRPYKRGKKISECLKIMDHMRDTNHIDPDIFEVFIKEKVWLQYAKEELSEDQIDITVWESKKAG